MLDIYPQIYLVFSQSQSLKKCLQRINLQSSVYRRERLSCGNVNSTRESGKLLYKGLHISLVVSPKFLLSGGTKSHHC